MNTKISKEDILETVSNMSAIEIMELVSMIEKKFGVSSNSSDSLSRKKVSEEKEKEQTEFSIFLNEIGKNKISVIKIIRAATNLGLKESKDLVESAPILIKEGLDKVQVNVLKKSLEEVGAVVEIR